jgi:hypothetical protein
VESLKKDDFKAFDALFYKYSENLYAFALSITRDSFAAVNPNLVQNPGY